MSQQNTNKSLLFVARNYPPKLGGLEILNYELYNELCYHFDVELIKNNAHRYSIFFLIKGLFGALVSKSQLVLLSDAVLSVYIPFLKLIGKRVVIRVNGLDITHANWLYQALIPQLVNLADSVICISVSTKQVCLAKGIQRNKIIVLPPGIHTRKLTIPKIYCFCQFSTFLKKHHINKINPGFLLTVGRLVERKGHAWFIRNVVTKLPQEVTYLVAGDGSEKKFLRQLIVRLNLSSRVYLLGEVSEQEKKLLLHYCGLFIIPNIPVKYDVEGFGITAIEAAIAGKPVICSGIEGLKDAIRNQVNGITLKPYDVEGYINTINKFLTDKELCITFGIKAQEYTSKIFDWQKVGMQYVRLLRKYV